MADENGKQQPEPTPQPNSNPSIQIAETWNAALIACVRRVQDLEAAKLLQQHLLDEHEARIAQQDRRIAALEAILSGSGTAN
jgi:hypothetical protein